MTIKSHQVPLTCGIFKVLSYKFYRFMTIFNTLCSLCVGSFQVFLLQYLDFYGPGEIESNF